MGVRDLSEFVGLIYDSVVDRSACPVMLKRLADLLGATSGVQFGTYDSTTHLAAVLAPRQGPNCTNFVNIGRPYRGATENLQSAQ